MRRVIIEIDLDGLMFAATPSQRKRFEASLERLRQWVIRKGLELRYESHPNPHIKPRIVIYNPHEAVHHMQRQPTPVSVL